MNRWYADDGTLIGQIDEVAKALDIITKQGPRFQFFLNSLKTRVFWPNRQADLLSPLLTVGPPRIIDAGGVDPLGAPIGSPNFMEKYIREKLKTCKTALAHLDHIPEARMPFHLHRVSASAYRLQHVFRLVPP